MCGIVGITADGEIVGSITRMLVDGLKRLEYRGYDSAGFALIECGTARILVFKDKGRISHVVEKYGIEAYCSHTGIAHTRWATHGEPSQRNAHPHIDCRSEIAVVHNGIIKNFAELRELLASKGHMFRSDTDTEVIAHLFEEYVSKGLDGLEALRKIVQVLEGAYAIAIINAREPLRIYFARRVSPLIIGLGEGFNMVSSDIPSILPYTRRVIVLEDGEYGFIEPYKVYIEKDGKPINWRTRVIRVEWSIEDAEKGGYPHYMLKEIMEQPRVLYETYTGLLSSKELAEAAKLIASARKVFITGAGTSYHAGLVFAYYIARYAKRVATPFIASEYTVYSDVADEDSVLIAVSQSGETIDTLQALRAFKSKGAKIIAVSNVLGSTIPRESHTTIYTRAGPEIGVAATKTFLTQVLALTSLALTLATEEGTITTTEYKKAIEELALAGRAAARSIDASLRILDKLVLVLKNKGNMYILSRGIGVPLAYEAALKVKEVSYIHAEAYPAGESKHGPIALVERDFPVIFLGVPPEDVLLEKLQGNVMEMKARGAHTIVIGTTPYGKLEGVDVFIDVGSYDELLIPYAIIPPAQLLAYKLAVALNRDPDKPRNLAKTVTVE
ncbi:glutamine--fructose-6-phosphate transaminase (isomerizing) [Hyperthermus butylicus]|uniref:Glutamine--fructose-6-phosphate aminotransferase [isomerizing] n=1 Tax=Hyperthermus butylicus (strain DSM 5456 / JCM 9403 / PLM1-5) TaxID=415426 RepID=A2BLF2_HYPBU|nr:glutamine--fructose-6-phosphate transaminase (isomerizing) [Hyperthermus butylicus]ABM80813.1 glucosamine-fructose-6-phosphate aminotransferase [Hyperthermus butylicus DSM 5456]